jgi:hypothetical protein
MIQKREMRIGIPAFLAKSTGIWAMCIDYSAIIPENGGEFCEFHKILLSTLTFQLLCGIMKAM